MKYFFISIAIIASFNAQAMSIDQKYKLIREYAVVGSVICGWAFYGVTSKCQTHLPYWAKRLPLFGFLAANTVIHAIPLFSGQQQNPDAIHALKDAASTADVFNSLDMKSNMCAI